MQIDDADAVATLCGQLGYPADARSIRRRFAHIYGYADHALFVACVAGAAVVGWVHAHGKRLLEVEPFAEIGGLVVDSAYRGRGVGRALMAEAERWALDRGYAEIILRSRSDRAEAHRFYKGIGYAQVSSQHKYRKSLVVPRALGEPSPALSV